MAPRITLIHESVADDPSSVAGSCDETTTSRMLIAAATPKIHPVREATPFWRARSENSIRMTATIGMGMIVSATAIGRNSQIA